MKRDRSFPLGPADFAGTKASKDPHTTKLSNEPFELSLVGSGPADRLFSFLNLADEHLDFNYRRIVAVCAVTWLLLFILSVFEGPAVGGGSVQKPFLGDNATHLRFLAALSLLLAGDTLVRRILDPRVASGKCAGISRNG